MLHAICGGLLLVATLFSNFELARSRPFWSIATNLDRFCCSRLVANVAIRGRRRRTRGAIDDVCFIILHEI